MSFQQESEELQCRKLLLDSYSSQLTTHARLIIGSAIMLLTLLGAKGYIQRPISDLQFCVFYFGVFMVAFSLWFLIMRHLVYGVLVTATLHARPLGEGNLLTKISAGARQRALNKRIFYVIPVCLFYSTGTAITRLQRLFRVRGARMLGALLCVFLAFMTTFFVWILMG